VTVTRDQSPVASFTYDGDGKRVKAVEGSETILFIGAHFELNTTTGEVTKYYMAGATRVAVRKYTVPSSSELTYLLGDHLGSTSLATDETGALLVETRYKAWGEVRYTTENSTLPTRYTYTGQYSYVSDDATDLGNLGFGLMYYGARFYDPALGRFSSADTIIPEQTQGTQAWDRFAYVNNNPIRNADPTGHIGEDCGDNPETCKDIPTQQEPPLPPEPNQPPKRPAFSYSEENGVCISYFCSGGTSYAEWWHETWWPYLSEDAYDPDAGVIGVGVSGSEPGIYNTAGLEDIIMFSNGTRATFVYAGQGGSAGLGASGSGYVGIVFNLDDPENYNGPFASAGITISVFDVVGTASYFWDDTKSPLSSGTTQGFAVGYAPGAQASLWWSSTIYTMNWRSDK